MLQLFIAVCELLVPKYKCQCLEIQLSRLLTCRYEETKCIQRLIDTAPQLFFSLSLSCFSVDTATQWCIDLGNSVATKGSYHHVQMATMASSGDITPPESRPKENEKSRRAPKDLEVQSVVGVVAAVSQYFR